MQPLLGLGEPPTGGGVLSMRPDIAVFKPSDLPIVTAQKARRQRAVGLNPHSMRRAIGQHILKQPPVQ
jgi:hypothetical protein